MKRGVAISDYLQPLQPNQTQCYLTNTLQVADIVEWVLSQIGKSTIWQTSFSISEEFLRRLYFISKSGNVDTIHLLLDFKATQKTLRLWAFLTQVIGHTYLADNHSKVILIQSAAMSVAIITSQNLTRGNRHESAIVTTDPAIFHTLHEQIEDLIRNHSVPLSELYNAQVK
ncbi:MAG: hypothetical protein SOT07_01325 [Paludibacteraceae bacterium]|nr:hypothetical protein [Paludibacteraceae bacterium]